MEPIGIVGHIAIDRILTEEGERLQVGGPPTYASLVTCLLGVPLTIRTKVGSDFLPEYAEELAARGVDLRDSVVTGAETTRFLIDYRGAERRMGLEAVCSPLRKGDAAGLPRAVMLAPIAGELTADFLEALDSPILALDPQGFLRQRMANGVVTYQRWSDPTLLGRSSVLKASGWELRLIAGIQGWAGLEKLSRIGVKIAIETRGEEGSLVLAGGTRLVVPAYPTEAVDPTGAGDAYIAGFFAKYVAQEDPGWCSSVGSAAASAVVETVGPRVRITKDELMERAESVHNRIRTLG